jgi:predicted transcriptional regulator of viral defense system
MVRALKPRSPPFSAQAFFERFQVFTFEGFREAHATTGTDVATTSSLLAYHLAQKHVTRLRRGLFVTAGGSCDPWVLATLLTPDGVIAYDGALAFHELARFDLSVSLLSRSRLRPWLFDDIGFRAIQPPRSLKKSRALTSLVEHHVSGGHQVRVTSVERTLVDVLDRLDLIEDAWTVVTAFRAARRLDVAALVDHALALDHAITAARLGSVLEGLALGSRAQLKALEDASPASPAYFDATTRQEQNAFGPRWNLVVPVWLIAGLRGQRTRAPRRPFSG